MISIYSFSSAQRYLPNPALDKFAGTWVYNHNGKTLEVTLRKVRYDLINLTTDKIEGYYTYKIDGKVIENTRQRVRPTLRNGTNLSNGDIKDTSQITLSLFDSTKRKSGDLILIFHPGKPDELTWLLNNREGLIPIPVGGPKFDATFTLPQTMLFKREN